jgi:hypothetical protein
MTDHAASSPRPLSALAPAAAASAAAGLVHAAAAGSHGGDSSLMLLFAVVAAAQLGWAGVAMARDGRGVAAVGVVLNLAFVAAWAVSRMSGLPVIDSLAAREAVGTQDLLAAVLGGVAVLLAGWVLAGRPSAALTRGPAPALAAVAVLALAVPGMAAEHNQGPSHDHGHGGELVAADADHGHDDGHGRDDAELAADGHGHDDDDHHEARGPIISVDDPRLTPEQRAAAQELIDATTIGMQRFPDVASVEAAGYISIGDSSTGFEHYINIGHIASPDVLDPDAIESIVFKVNPDGSREPVSAMYILPFGQTMDDVPEIAGELTMWHDHQDLCWEGARVVATLDAEGNCPRGTFRPTAPMLHVWMVDHECGPFAGLEGAHGSGCAHDDHDEDTDEVASGS